MYQIKKMRANQVIDFAAEELKKYLRMMMPECGDIEITYEPNATEGFRLGLGEDFGLTFDEVKDAILDDVVHIDTDEQGGIFAGSNPRSVLFAVYRYLKEHGCRWLFAGIDGEYIPICEIKPIKYHHIPSFRFRGSCDEGAESQQCMLETIDLYAKLEMNIYKLEFDNPFAYYDRYYSHTYNKANRKPEPISLEQAKQWKRQCEVEIVKRGLIFIDMGHGWSAEPFGLNSTNGWNANEDTISEELLEQIRPHLALVNGKRDVWRNTPLKTQLCLSNPETRTIFAQAVVNYAERHQNVTYLVVGLGDDINNHCECDECKKLRITDYFVMILNQIDEILTERGLDTRIGFGIYHERMFKPIKERLKNPERFVLGYAPITRSYTSSIKRENIGEVQSEYVVNAYKPVGSVEENAAFLLDWQTIWKGNCYAFEYHFWVHLFRDPGTMRVARRVYEDILALDELKLCGFIEDGTQRPFFPNGFAIYVLAEALLNKKRDYEEIKEDYFSHAYGECWKEVVECLNSMSELFDYAYMEGEKTIDKNRGKYYNPAHVEDLKKVKEVAAKERALAEENRVMPVRAQTVAMRLLFLHAEYCERLAEVFMEKTIGNQDKAKELLNAFSLDFGRYEIEIERYYDHFMMKKTMDYYISEKIALY